MKKLMIVLTALFTMTVSANAMSYEQARDQALFLTDKMAYELNLTEDQYEAAFEINLDYLMSVETVDDLYGTFWTRRNLDLSYILLDWQYRAYLAANYFYRPLYWDGGFWHFGIYARYPHRSYFYFGRPHFYVTYRGGHSWHMNGGRSWYHGRSFGMSHRSGTNMHGFGMRNGLDRGDFRRHSGDFVRYKDGKGLERRRDDRSIRDNGNFRGYRGNGNYNRNSDMGRSNGTVRERGNGTAPQRSGSVESRSGSMNNNRSGNYGGIRGNGSFGGNRSSYGQRESSTRTTVGGNHLNSQPRPESRSVERSSSSSRSYSTPNRTFSPSRSSGSFSSSPSRSSGSFSSSPSRSSGSFSSSPSRSSSMSTRSSSVGSHRSSGGGHSGGGHFGGRR